VTVRQLLAHTGGGPVGSGLGPEYVSPREVVERISKYPLRYEPDTKYQYTTSGYNLLGAAIEEVSGKSFGDYLREHIFLPLGMNDTRMNSERELIPNRVRTYTHHALKNGRYAALDYVLGWWNLALNGQWVSWHGGAQIGTGALFYRCPSKNMAIAFAVNTHDAYPP
jgi:CubicO group peptidase (beta-lactamase class C family)